MNDHSKTILWLGLLMILLQVVNNWPAIRAVLFASKPSPFGIPIIPPLTVPGKGKGKGGTGEEPPPEEPPVEPVVPEIPVVAAHYTPTSRG